MTASLADPSCFSASVRILCVHMVMCVRILFWGGGGVTKRLIFRDVEQTEKKNVCACGIIWTRDIPSTFGFVSTHCSDAQVSDSSHKSTFGRFGIFWLLAIFPEWLVGYCSGYIVNVLHCIIHNVVRKKQDRMTVVKSFFPFFFGIFVTFSLIGKNSEL